MIEPIIDGPKWLLILLAFFAGAGLAAWMILGYLIFLLRQYIKKEKEEK